MRLKELLGHNRSFEIVRPKGLTRPAPMDRLIGMRKLVAASCTALTLAGCSPQKGGRVDVVVNMGSVRLDDTARAQVSDLSRQIRTGFSVGRVRQNGGSPSLAFAGQGPAWADYMSQLTHRDMEAGALPWLLAAGPRTGARSGMTQPFRLRSNDRSTRGKIRLRGTWGADSQVVASGPLSVLRDLVMPVAGIAAADLRDTYSSPRPGHRIHGAIDIHAPMGTPVVATVAGTVWKIRWDLGGGRTVHLLDESGNFVFYYAHLSRYAKGLREGQTVQRGDLLGYVGNSGDVVGSPHLHLRIGRVPADREHWWDTKPLNPYPLLKSASTVLP
jgi:murein DD-endopeptidase MepM/ murein hydrolase activator NlpD